MSGLLTDPKGNARRIRTTPHPDDDAPGGRAHLAAEGARYAVLPRRGTTELAGHDDLHAAMAHARAVVGRVYRRADGVLLAWCKQVAAPAVPR